jgi:hypothetical protein
MEQEMAREQMRMQREMLDRSRGVIHSTAWRK